MLETLVRACVDKRAFAVLVTLIFGVYGFWAFRQTPIEAFPDVTNVQVTVITQQPGYAPEEIERQITIPVERALNGTPGLQLMRSESLFGLSLVTLIFHDDVDPFQTRTLVSQRAAQADLPDGVQPELSADSTPLGKVFIFRMTSDRHNTYEMRAELEWTVARVLRQVPGVAEVVGIGGHLEEIHVEVDPARLVAHDLTLADVTEALSDSNLNVGGGFLRHGDQEMVIRSVGMLTDERDVKDVVVDAEDGTPVTVGDIARVLRSHTPRRGSAGLDLTPEVVEGFVLMRRNENPSLVLDGIHAKVDELRRGALPEGMDIEVLYDRGVLIEHTLHTVYDNLLHGFLLICGVVWLFLRSIRGAAVVAVVIPLSLLTAFAGLHYLGLPANLISMGAIDFGILVDGAVVLVETVIHHLRHERPKSKREILRIVARSAVDVSRPTLFAMAIIIAALLPVFTLEQVEGRIFRPLALTYSFALVGALVFALTTVPALLAVAFGRKGSAGRDPRWIERLRDAYRRAVEGMVARKRRVALLCGGLLLLTGLAGRGLGTEFLPELDEGNLVVFVEMPTSTSLEKGSSLLLEVRRRLLRFPEVRQVMTEQGRPEDGTDNEGVNMAKTYVQFHDRGDWRPGVTPDLLTEQMRAELSEIPGVRFNFSQPIKDSVEEAISGVRGKVVVKIYGSDLVATKRTLEAIKAELQDIPGVVDLDLYRDATIPQLQIRLDRSALAREGVNIASAQDVVETALAGRVATEMWRGERIVPVRVRVLGEERQDVDRIAALQVRSPSGARVPLDQLAVFEQTSGRAIINRENNQRFLALKFNIGDRDMGSVVADAMKVVEERIELPEGATLAWGGEFENQERAMGRLKRIVPVSLLIVFGLLYGALGSLRGSALILAMMPLGLTGGVFGLRLAGIPLSVSAAIGFIALLGQVSLLGLLVVSGIENYRRGGHTPLDAAVGGAVERFRGVLLAALLAMLGLMPMAMSSGMGSETQRPFAVVIVGGMVTTLLAILFVVPLVYPVILPDRPVVGDDDEEDL